MKPGRALALAGVLAWLVGAAPGAKVQAQAQAQPQALADPTRPPPEAALPPGAEAPPSGPHRPQLQSVLVGKDGMRRAVAVIDGRIVRRGDKVDGAVLESVSANQAVLRRGNKKEVLKVFPLPAAPAKAVKN